MAEGTGMSLWSKIDGPLTRKLMRYGSVSVVSTSVSLTVLGSLVALNVCSAGWANVIATACGTVPSFELNRRWVWGKRTRRSLHGEIGPFCALSFAGLGLSTWAVSAAAGWASTAGLGGVGRTLAVLAANATAFGSLWILQFVILDRVMFGPRPPVEPDPTERFDLAA